MTLDNGATHRQSDSHPASLGCVERVKEFVEALSIYTYARILHCEAHMVVVVTFTSDQ